MAIITNATIEVQRYIATQTTGVAPLGITSTTEVTNLNVDKLEGQDGSYYLALTNATGTLTAAKGGTGLTAVGAADTVPISNGSVLAYAKVADANVDAAAAIAWTKLSKTGSSLADLATRSASDLSSGTVATARLGSGTADSTTFLRGDNTWATPAGGSGNSFVDIENSSAAVQFSASGSDALQFAAGADLSVAFDAVNKRVTFAYTGSGSGILRGYADITADSGTSAASGADTLIVTGAGGISTTSASGPDTLTITLGNHSGNLITSGTVGPTVGGTGLTTYATGDLLYASGANTLAKLAAGTDGYVLTLASGVPTWAAGGGSVSTSADYTWTGLHTFNRTVTGTVGADVLGVNFTGALTEAGSGTHALIAGVKITAPTITGGTATVTDAASLYISAAPTATVTGGTYAVWVDAGNTRFDGITLLNNALTTGASAGDIVAGNDRAFRGSVLAGTSSVALLRMGGNNRVIIGCNSDYLEFENAATSTSAVGGAATALPSQPAGYFHALIGGTFRKIPYYAAS